MNRFRVSIVLGIAAIVLFLVLLLRGLSMDPRKVPSVLVGKKAQDFNVEVIQSIDGLPVDLTPEQTQMITLAKILGKPIVLNFWASWCVSCREEAKELENFWQMYKDKGVLVLGIAIQDEKSQALKFAQLMGKKYPLALDNKGQSTIDYGVYGVPETFIIDRNGIIQYKESGPVTASLLEEKIKPLL